MKKFKLALSSLILATTIIPFSHAEAKSTQPTYKPDQTIVNACKVNKQLKKADCYNHTNIYFFKAVSKHKLQDLLYYDYTEYSKQTLNVGKYYKLVYYHDTLIHKEQFYNLTQGEKIMLDYSYKAIKEQQNDTKEACK